MKVFFLLNLVLLYGVNCGFLAHHPSRRIVDGFEAKPADYKFQVAIMSNHKFRCSGSIIAADAVLTTARCVTNSNGPFTILAGTHDLKGAGHIFEVQKVVKHPKLGSTRKDVEDLCIIQTTKSMTELNDSNIDYVQLNFKARPEDAMVNISGWGATSFLKNGNSHILRYATVKLLHWNQCLSTLLPRMEQYHDAFCTDAGKNPGSLCWHDQGGPVVYNKTLIGVSAKSFMCSNPNIHIGVKDYAEWINNVISSF